MSKCSCIQSDEWNIDIEVLDTKTIKFVDYSVWNTTYPYVVPDFHKVTMEIPELSQKFELNIKPNDSTIITVDDLNINGCLPDGIFCFEAYSCYSCKDNSWGERKFTIHKAVLPQTQCKVASLIATHEDESLALTFHSKLKQLEAVSRIGQTSKAQDLFSSLQDDLNNYKCKSCC